ncbi:MAG: restriction endonuclease [Saprospiraceae bacterium]|nr:restriction endonuclease [Candidatus Vicinibacter affinis]MBK6572852.1 restriction endonuclease [Candidatus Vicinibacter affinis]MBK7798566.1 restriction endonuclease [Candidatus Vicinibacter affinis]MBK8405855.1 restriction endonuclease [Candidatus Vicinibacter affinis]
MKRRTIREAVIEVLKRCGKPMSSKDIYDYIIKHDLYRFNAENPLNIVNGEIRRHCVGIDFPTAKSKKDFQILIDGTFWIKDLEVPGQTSASIKSEKIVRKDSDNLKEIVSELKAIHKKHNDAFKKQILSQLKEISPQTFEVFAKRLLEVYGFIDMKVASYVKDGGIDGHGKLKVGITFLNVAFQCKRWSTNSVSRTEIDKFRGAIQGSFEQGIIFTTSSFSKEALNATRRNGAVPIILIDGSTLVDFMIEKKFGVESENIPVYINALDNALIESEP